MTRFAQINQRYALEMRLESVPDLWQRFGLTFPVCKRGGRCVAIVGKLITGIGASTVTLAALVLVLIAMAHLYQRWWIKLKARQHDAAAGRGSDERPAPPTMDDPRAGAPTIPAAQPEHVSHGDLDAPSRPSAARFHIPSTASILIALAVVLGATERSTSAADRLCDASFEDCRTPLINLIRNETSRIDVAFWFMSDARYSNEIIKRWQAGVEVRVLLDTRANAEHPENAAILQQLRDAGIPLRNKTGSGILHWKMMLFDAQDTVEFSGANYSPYAFVPIDPYRNYEDEVIYFADGAESPTIVQSIRTSFEDLWTDTSRYSDYANITGPLLREYPIYPKDAELNFPAAESYRNRAIAAYDVETSAIDISMFRITDRTHADAIIRAINRGIPVRLLTDETEYRNIERLWHSWNVDRMYGAGIVARNLGRPGIDIHLDAHQNVMHQKSILLHDQGLTIFGSSNWTSPSAGGSSDRQDEHNYFTTRVPFFNWFFDQFERKWNNTNPVGATETKPFAPLPPNKASIVSPTSGATGLATPVSLTWYGGPWAHLYDVYLGTDPANLLPIAVDANLGPSESTTDYQQFTVSNLNGGTTYYWAVVSETMAGMTATSSIWSFTTGGSPGPRPGLPSPWQSVDIGTTVAGDGFESFGTFTVKGAGVDVWDAADAFHYVYRPLHGDGEIVARVATIENVDAWTKVGVMLRESLDAGSRHAFMLVSSGKGIAFQRRTLTNGTSTGTPGGSGTAPYFVKLARMGSSVTASTSPDGSTWTVVGSDTVPMGTSAFAGLAVSSHEQSVRAMATFDAVSVSTTAGGDTTPPAVSLTQPVDGATVSGSTTVAADASDDVGVNRVEFRIDGALGSTDTTAPYSFAWDTTAVVDGAHSVETRAFDAAGNSSSKSIGVTVANGGETGDTTPPVVTLTQPFDGAIVSGTTTVSASTTDDTGVARVELWLDAALLLTDTVAPHDFSWNTATVADGNHTLEARAFDTAGNSASSGGIVVNVSNGGSTGELPAPWTHADVGSVSVPGDATEAGGTFTVDGDGADIWGTADAFHFVYQALAGNGQIVARVATVANVDVWTKAGVMIRESLWHGSRHAHMLVSPGKGLAFQRRRTADGLSTNTSGGAGTAAAWVKLVRAGNVFTAYRSSDGLTWTTVGTDTIPMNATALIGLAVTSHTDGTVARATFDHVSVVSTGLPPGWSDQDIGAVTHAGSSWESGGTFEVTGSGADVWNNADGFHQASHSLSGDGEIVAHVATLENTDPWAKAGVMMRDTLDPGSAHAFMLVSAEKGLAFQRRVNAGGSSTYTSGGAGTAPMWVRLQRTGSTFDGYVSSDGASWTLVGTDTIAMGTTIRVSLAVTAHDSTTLCTATFDNVVVVQH